MYWLLEPLLGRAVRFPVARHEKPQTPAGLARSRGPQRWPIFRRKVLARSPVKPEGLPAVSKHVLHGSGDRLTATPFAIRGRFSKVCHFRTVTIREQPADSIRGGPLRAETGQLGYEVRRMSEESGLVYSAIVIAPKYRTRGYSFFSWRICLPTSRSA